MGRIFQLNRAARIAPLLFLAASLTAIGRFSPWGDEVFTMQVLAWPTSQMVERVGADIHPPLYYLSAKAWTALPLPGTLIERLRWHSAVWGAIAVFLFDLLWLRKLSPGRRALGLAMFCLAPSILLYSRMGRSYLMQCSLALLAAWAARRAIEKWSWDRILASAATLALLLYTHYVPGIAIWAALNVASLRRMPAARLAALDATVFVLYAPWIATLAGALGRWNAVQHFSASYRVTGNAVFEHAAKLAYAGVSFSIGESFPAICFVVVPLFAGLLVAGLWRIGRKEPRWLLFLLTAGVLGYAGVARWVSYPFVPARTLWLLPFAILAVLDGAGRRWWLVLPVLAAGVTGWLCYWTRTGFLNPGYAVPLEEIVSTIRRESGPDAVVLCDQFNTDGEAIRVLLGVHPPHAWIEPSRDPQALRNELGSRETWVVRNERDISPGLITTRTEAAVCDGRRRRDWEYLELPDWQRAALRAVAGGEPPRHFYRLTVCSGP